MYANKKVRGAVSVFLVMILVPCIVVSSVFVDLGRVHMSKSMAASASDLSLNSLMANYDADLSEWYGMAASCQSIDEFYEMSAQFFLRTISSQGLSDDEIVLLSDYYANATNDDTIYDLLQIECQTAPSDMIKPITGANLTNAALLKEQTVEFMKYRAPIELTLGIIDRLKSDSTVSDAVDSDENKQLIDDKTAFFEAEGDLLAAAFNSYLAVYKYSKEAEQGGLKNTQLESYANKLTTYKSAYEDINKLYISNLHNTSGLTTYSRVTYALDKYNTTYTEKSEDVHSRKETDDDDVTHYYIDGTDITALLKDLETEISDFETAKTNFSNAASTLMAKQPGSGANQSNAIQWWVQMNAAVNSSGGHTSKYNTAAQNMLKAYSKVLAIKLCELGDNIPDNWETKFTELTTKVSTLREKYLKAGVTDSSDAYLKAVKKLEDVSSANIHNITSTNLYITINGERKNIDSAIVMIKNELTSMRAELQKYVDLLTVAIDGNGSDTGSLDSLKSLSLTYENALINWGNTADSTNTSMAEQDRQSIAGTLTGEDAANNISQDAKKINEAAVTELKDRLVNIRSQINSLISAIDTLKYGGTSISSITSYSLFKTAIQTKVSSSSIKLTNQELSNYAATVFGQLFSPSSTPVFTMSNLGNTKYNPEIDPVTKAVDTPELYVYLHSKFQGMTKDTIAEKKSELDTGKSEGASAESAARDKGRYHGGGSDITKDFSGTETFNLLDGSVSGLMNLVDSLVNLDITNIRDDLYVTSYIMNMFSYATYEEEGLYQLVEKKDELYLPSSGYRPSEYDNCIGAVDQGKTWLSEDFKDSYNKSLTNKLINKTNNSAYAAEVEYILYGGRTDKGNADNVKAVYSNIYGIRYTLNLVSGFKNFWSPRSSRTAAVITSVARAIQAATSGIIPAPLTKVILIPILTAFETSKDLDRLEAGFPVELFKTTDKEWWIKVPDGETVESVSGLTSIFKRAFNGPNPDNGISYSDYLTLFVYLGLQGNCAEDMYQRMAEVMQANMRKLTGKTDYSMSKAQVYFKSEATIRVKPLMITLPIFNDYRNNMSTKTDWCTYKVSTVRGYT